LQPQKSSSAKAQTDGRAKVKAKANHGNRTDKEQTQHGQQQSKACSLPRPTPGNPLDRRGLYRSVSVLCPFFFSGCCSFAVDPAVDLALDLGRAISAAIVHVQ
jgi:hypothetical protein